MQQQPESVGRVHLSSGRGPGPAAGWIVAASLLAEEFGPGLPDDLEVAAVPVVACRILMMPVGAEFAAVGDVLTVSVAGMTVRVRGVEWPSGVVEVEWLDAARLRGARRFRIGSAEEIAEKTWQLMLEAAPSAAAS